MRSRMLMCVPLVVLLVCCSDLCCGYVNYVHWGMSTCGYSSGFGPSTSTSIVYECPSDSEPIFLNAESGQNAFTVTVDDVPAYDALLGSGKKQRLTSGQKITIKSTEEGNSFTLLSVEAQADDPFGDLYDWLLWRNVDPFGTYDYAEGDGGGPPWTNTSVPLDDTGRGFVAINAGNVLPANGLQGVVQFEMYLQNDGRDGGPCFLSNLEIQACDEPTDTSSSTSDLNIYECPSDRELIFLNAESAQDAFTVTVDDSPAYDALLGSGTRQPLTSGQRLTIKPAEEGNSFTLLSVELRADDPYGALFDWFLWRVLTADDLFGTYDEDDRGDIDRSGPPWINTSVPLDDKGRGYVEINAGNFLPSNGLPGVVQIEMSLQNNGMDGGPCFVSGLKIQACDESSNSFVPLAKPVYRGYVSKSMWQGKGGGSEYICLPEKPEWGDVIPGMQSTGGLQNSRIYGTQFFEAGLSPDFISEDYMGADVPCTVCETTVAAHGQMLMIPGRLTCPIGWKKQYGGLLMAEPSKKKKSQSNYICVNKRGFLFDNDNGGTHARMSPVEVGCGVLPCNTYPEGRELRCVVCVK